MKTFLRFLLIILVIGLVVCGWAIYTYPFLAPGYRSKYSAANYEQVVTRMQKPVSAAEWLQAFDTLYPYWLGTRWNFNGTTQIPGEGSIACGYFVTTMIEDMQVPIERIAMAQCASEVMIKKQVEAGAITRYNLHDNETLFNYLRNRGNHLYIIGLDNHTGFIRQDSTGTWFIHSSGRFPYRVIREDATSSKTICDSKYKVLGCLSEGAVGL